MAEDVQGSIISLEQAGNLAERRIASEQVDEVAVQRIVETTDLSDSTAISRYGEQAQRRTAQFSERALGGVRTKDLGELGELITGLTTEIKTMDPQQEMKGGFFGFLKKTEARVERFRTRYTSVSKNIDRIEQQLDGQRMQLITDSRMLDELYQTNLDFYRELTAYIVAGERKLQEVRTGELQELQTAAAKGDNPEATLKVQALSSSCERFEKKLHDLKTTRTYCFQLAPQILIIQNTDDLMIDKIQTLVTNTIPIWRSGAALAIGLQHSQMALEMVHQINDATNEMLRRQSEMLKSTTLGIAEESERSVIDIETLEQVNRDMIDTLRGVAQIQEQGRQCRADAEVRMRMLEEELRQNILSLGTATA